MMAQETGAKPNQRTRPGRRPVVVFFLVLAALVGAGIVPDLANGFEAACTSLDTGAAERALEALVRVSGAARATESEV